MAVPTIIGSSIPRGVEQLKLHQKMKLGDIVLTFIPRDKREALALARYCRENKIYLCFSELVFRGSYDLAAPYRELIPREQFHSKADMDEIIDTAGEYYYGRFTLGEVGGVLYWPKAYTIGRLEKNWENLPYVQTAAEARDAYIGYMKKWMDFERKELGKGPLMAVDSSLVFKYLAQAGVDVLGLEVMPGDPHLMHAAARGAARAYNKPWGAHIAMACYGGMNFDELWQKRWQTSLYYSYITGANFIYPESGHYTHDNARHQNHGFRSREMKRVRRILREAYQFSRIHIRPPDGPRVGLGVVHGNLDGSPGLWNRYAWGQYRGKKWLEGPPERGWRLVDKFHRKEDWNKETVQGDMDFSGNPPYGQYDVVPVEARLEVLQRYPCLIFLGWNTMTPAIYRKLKQYVKAGGHLVMYLAQLSTHTDRADDLKLYRNGDFRDLFGVKVLGKGKTDVMGVKCMANSAIKSYRLPFWRISTDPRFMGLMTPARVKVTTARVLSGHDYQYRIAQEELAKKPFLVENSLGKGKAFLVTVWEYPADEGVSRFTDDLLRTLLDGEQGEIRLLASDRVRYAVYDGKARGSRRRYSAIYLLNTDPDCSSAARLWLRGQLTEAFDLPANELRIAYYCGGLLLIAEDKCVDLKSWQATETRDAFDFFSARNQKLEIHNTRAKRTRVSINGKTYSCPARAHVRIALKRTVDPARKGFFAPGFLKEPNVRCDDDRLPY